MAEIYTQAASILFARHCIKARGQVSPSRDGTNLCSISIRTRVWCKSQIPDMLEQAASEHSAEIEEAGKRLVSESSEATKIWSSG